MILMTFDGSSLNKMNSVFFLAEKAEALENVPAVLQVDLPAVPHLAQMKTTG